MNKRISILSTAPLGNDVVAECDYEGVSLDIIPFIEVEYISTPELKSRVLQLAKQTTDIVFTSKHAVSAVAQLLDGNLANEWRIYCLDSKTKNTVIQLFGRGSLAGTGHDAGSLADAIAAEGTKQVVFFCGDKRMDTLPEKLQSEGVRVEELTVYKTSETPQKLENSYDGILFFSPSGVSSFFSKNEPDRNVVLFAIGNTTAEALKKYANHKIIVSNSPVKRQVLVTAVEYFRNIKLA